MTKAPIKFLPMEIGKVWGKEIWLLSGYHGHESVVAEGPFEGRSLTEVAGRDFPLLIKILEVNERLSLQVHPNEKTAKFTGGDPKTEMWYILKQSPGARILAGLKHGIGRYELEEAVASGRVERVINSIEARERETLFIPGGMVHSVGAGYRILEVQQTSDTTFRFHDWDRRDPLTGKCRKLHLAESFATIDYSLPSPKIIPRVPRSVKSVAEIVSSPEFRLATMRLKQPIKIEATQPFSVVFSEHGNVIVRNSGGETQISVGELAFVEAEEEFYLIPEESADILIIGMKEFKAMKTKKVQKPSMTRRRDDFVRVEMPLRIDLAGGWSDTPPICQELGGCVLNAAVMLDGIKPVVAEVKKIAKNAVLVESVDLGKHGILTKREEIYGEQDPHDWCALVKSALSVIGYEFSKGGLHIRISADVPKGSGMGTSSILGAALLTALAKILGKKDDWETIAGLTLQLEATMGTGGGWEDQLGALIPGVKLVSSKPGKKQKFFVKRLPATAEEKFKAFVRERGVLFFTGQKRMARNVLRGVIGFYRKNPEGIAEAIIKALKKDASKSFEAIKNGDYKTFTANMNAYWMNKKALDPGSTNPEVESIIARIAPWTDAVMLCGAGGGGFLFAIARSRLARVKMESVLANAGNGGRCYRFSL